MNIRFDQSAPYEVEEKDVPFARLDGHDVLARVYRPTGTQTAPLPALVDVHGGAWSRGDRTVGPHHGRGLAACGLVVVSLDFRQGPDHKHPAAAQDVSAGVRWVRANASTLGVDPARVSAIGFGLGASAAAKRDTTTWDVEGTWERGGVAARAEYLARRQSTARITTLGWYALAAYAVAPHRLQLVGRIQQFDPNDVLRGDRVTGYTGGAQYFLRGDDLKLQLEYTAFAEQGPALDNNRLIVQLQGRW